MTRLKPAVYWNNLKGGVVVISRYLKTLARRNISESTVISIIARLLCMQLNNADVSYRFRKARKEKLLPNVDKAEELYRSGYAAIRHDVTQCFTFGHLPVHSQRNGWRHTAVIVKKGTTVARRMPQTRTRSPERFDDMLLSASTLGLKRPEGSTGSTTTRTLRGHQLTVLFVVGL